VELGCGPTRGTKSGRVNHPQVRIEFLRFFRQFRAIHPARHDDVGQQNRIVHLDQILVRDFEQLNLVLCHKHSPGEFDVDEGGRNLENPRNGIIGEGQGEETVVRRPSSR
jgi:hypothetical protein